MTDIGCSREINEDSIGYYPELNPQKGFFAIIADGMGGHQAGEVASQKTVEIIYKYYSQSKKKTTDALKQAFIQANNAIYQISLSDSNLKGMGTTATAIAIKQGLLYFAHVGDSRLYRLRNNELSLLSKDHTVVNNLLSMGLLTIEQAENHPDKNLITRAIGTKPSVEIDVFTKPLTIAIGDYYILCSDGLYDLVYDDEIKKAILASLTLNKAGNDLIELAKKRGGYDNISIIITSIKPIEKNKKTIPITRY